MLSRLIASTTCAYTEPGAVAPDAGDTHQSLVNLSSVHENLFLKVAYGIRRYRVRFCKIAIARLPAGRAAAAESASLGEIETKKKQEHRGVAVAPAV